MKCTRIEWLNAWLHAPVSYSEVTRGIQGQLCSFIFLLETHEACTISSVVLVLYALSSMYCLHMPQNFPFEFRHEMISRLK